MVGIFEEAVKQNSLKTINEVALELELEPHVLRFWESKFSQIKPIKAKGKRRLYTKDNITTIALIKKLLYQDGFTIAGASNFINNGEKISNDNLDDVSLESIKSHLMLIRQELVALVG
jgi:DNA-binding transcriptional MerR regulator